jgi:hypothetical protein
MPERLDLPRRGLIMGGAALALAPRIAFAAPGKLTFAVFRNGARIGEHEMTITGGEGEIVASAEVAMTVRIGPIPVFKYSHRAVERWKDGQFVSIETFTSSNGKKQHVLARATDSAVTIDGPAGLVRAPADAVPLSHWNTASFSRPLFNQQEGKVLRVKATRLAANHWAIRGEAEIDDFYDAAGQWRALKGKLEDGSAMEYRRL